MEFLIDTGANKNYIKEGVVKGCIPVKRVFNVASVGGNVTIRNKSELKIFNSIGDLTKIEFFVLPNLGNFSGIIGDDTLRKVGAIIDRKNDLLIVGKYEIPLKARFSSDVFFTIGENLPHRIHDRINSLLGKYSKLFEPLSGNELIDTSIRAEVKTSTSEPIYSKSYPYPACMREEVERQVNGR